MPTPRTVIIGAGVAGLTVAALLAKAGHDVTVLEAHVDPGGCAATFFYKNYRFDAGATLVGGFQPGGPHDLVAQRLGLTWAVRRAEPAFAFHSPEGSLTRWGKASAWQAERQCAFGADSEGFWRAQERAADVLWRFASSLAPWPPHSARELATLSAQLLRQPALAPLAPLLVRSMQGWMDRAGARSALLKQFVDAQLLISAQATADECMALFGAVALDLPRAGVFHSQGGVGGIAETLADSVRALGGRVLYKAEVTRIEAAGGRVQRVHTRKKGSFEAGRVVANLPPWNIARLLGEDAPPALRQHVEELPSMWGAFMLYLGVNEEVIPPDFPAHHQLLQQPGLPLGEGNSVFLSISPAWDTGRAPPGQRALTLSTHTQVAPWWALRQITGGKAAYEARVARYSESLLRAAGTLLPALSANLRLQLPATPVTFEHFTRRHRGYVGGFPQRSLFATSAPRLPVEGLWMVGDSIFPGQSTAGVTLGALRVARAILDETPLRESTGQPVNQVR